MAIASPVMVRKSPMLIRENAPTFPVPPVRPFADRFRLPGRMRLSGLRGVKLQQLRPEEVFTMRVPMQRLEGQGHASMMQPQQQTWILPANHATPVFNGAEDIRQRVVARQWQG
jgi:hypothetical protein